MKKVFKNFTKLLIILLLITSFSFAEEFIPKYDILEPFIKIMAVDGDYLWAAGGSEEEFMKILYKSNDYGNTWSIVHIFKKTIEGIYINPNNNLFVSISNERRSQDAKCEIWRSTTNGSYFTKVLELESGVATNWNFASDSEGYVFISEYGNKKENNARKIYRSNNNGRNFQIVYNPEPIQGYHNHIISINKRNSNIIYQTVGDDQKFILMSKDRGNTWRTIIENYHPTSMVQVDNTILWGLDNYPCSGIVRYNLDSQKVDYSLITPKPFGGSIYDMIYVDDVIYAGTMSYDYDTWDGAIFISKDKGLTWENYLIIPRSKDIGVGIYNFVTQEDYIFAWVSMPIEVNGVIEKYQGSIRIEKISNN